jgi:hypothetical protein
MVVEGAGQSRLRNPMMEKARVTALQTTWTKALAVETVKEAAAHPLWAKAPGATTERAEKEGLWQSLAAAEVMPTRNG